MRLCNWDRADPAEVRRLYAAEEVHWRERLHWDTRVQWREVEQARRAGVLPGLVAHGDDGRPCGWAFYLPEDGVLQVGGLVADSAEATEALLDAVLTGTAAGAARAVCCFVPERAVGLSAALARRGFDLDPFHYLTLDLASAASSVSSLRPSVMPLSARPVTPATPWMQPLSSAELRGWTAEAVPDVARLFRSAYSRRIGRYFAPFDQPDEWVRYARNLVEQPGCGRFRPDLSLLATDPDGLRGVLLMTGLDPETAHVAQLAVAPAVRRQRLARSLVEESVRRARAAGFRRVTLLVAEANEPARALYRGLGFVARGRFLAAHREPTVSARLAG